MKFSQYSKKKNLNILKIIWHGVKHKIGLFLVSAIHFFFSSFSLIGHKNHAHRLDIEKYPNCIHCKFYGALYLEPFSLMPNERWFRSLRLFDPVIWMRIFRAETKGCFFFLILNANNEKSIDWTCSHVCISIFSILFTSFRSDLS